MSNAMENAVQLVVAAEAAVAAAEAKTKLPEFEPVDAATLRKRKAVHLKEAPASPRFSDTLKALHRRFQLELDMASPFEESTKFYVMPRVFKRAKWNESRVATLTRYMEHMTRAFPGVRITIDPVEEEDSNDVAYYEVHLTWSTPLVPVPQPRTPGPDDDY